MRTLPNSTSGPNQLESRKEHMEWLTLQEVGPTEVHLDDPRPN